jgi:hypothetical protein
LRVPHRRSSNSTSTSSPIRTSFTSDLTWDLDSLTAARKVLKDFTLRLRKAGPTKIPCRRPYRRYENTWIRYPKGCGPSVPQEISVSLDDLWYPDPVRFIAIQAYLDSLYPKYLAQEKATRSAELSIHESYCVPRSKCFGH